MSQTFRKIAPQDLAHFKSILGAQRVNASEEFLQEHAKDETEDLRFPPEVVLSPENAAEVSAIMRYCCAQGLPVTPGGARTGLSGGALNIYGGVALDTSRMNKILKIDTDNLQVHTQPGVITQVLQEEVAKHGLLYAVDPASRGSCFIGGNLAENSGGPRAVKYGVTKDWVLNLEVVLANGDIIWTGADTLKNSTGYNLTQLMVGSEGTLGIITTAVFKLLPLPKKQLLMLVPFISPEDACRAVAEVFKAGITPSAMEFMERDAIDWAMDFLAHEEGIPVADSTQAHLLIEVDGNNQDALMADCEVIMEVVERAGAQEVLFAEDQAQKDKLWMLRRKVGEAVKARSIYKEEDTVVPRFRLPDLLSGVKAIGEEYGFKSVCYGHAGDGNLHVNIIKGELSDEVWENKLPEAIEKIFLLTVSLGGTLSGEHGIGYVQKEYMPIAFSEIELNLMRKIKAVFDPTGILNPGKLFPETRNIAPQELENELLA